MVKKSALLFLIALVLLITLTGCDIFFGIVSLSPFPGYLSQAVASANMREEILAYVGGDDVEWRSAVHVLRNVAGEEYVFLIVQKDFGGQRVYALDTDLNIVSYDSVDSHNPLNLVDANDDFVVGNVAFDHTDMSLTFPYVPSVPVGWEDQAFSRPTIGNYILRSFSDTLDIDYYDPSWAFLNSISNTLGSSNDLWLRGVGFDPGVTDPLVGIDPVYLIFVGNDPNRDDEFMQIVRTPAVDYPALVTPVFNNPSYPVSSRVYKVRGHRSCYYTRKGVVAESHTRGRYLLATLNGTVIDRFWITAEDEPAMDFDIDGEYYYIFDEKDMRLYKAATGF